MTTAPPSPRLAAASAAYARKDWEAARGCLLAADGPGEAREWHLLALAERRRGDVAAAQAAFGEAVRLEPRDPDIWSNLGNLLGGSGRDEAALSAYGEALAIRPDHADARLNRGITLTRLGRPEEAAADLEAAALARPADPRAQAALGGARLAAGMADGAAQAFDAALALDAGRLTALRGRARVAMVRGEPDTAARYRAALAHHPADQELLLGLAEALEVAGDPGALSAMAAVAGTFPAWAHAQEQYARLRFEAGDRGHFADHFGPAIQAAPASADLHAAHWRSLVQGERFAEALAAVDAARSMVGESEALLLTEAIAASEIGDMDRAAAVLARLPDVPIARWVRGRNALRLRDPERAAAELEAMVAADPGAINGWAHLSVAWRMLGDPRQDWLAGQPGLVGSGDIGLDAPALARLADVLRGLHNTRAYPIGQSLRGGTQTRGRLLQRSEPELAELAAGLARVVEAHRAALPAADPRHPLLRHRDRRLRFGGSWSVRLAGAGFHVAHIHPEGVLSSACYIALPPGLGGAERAGWLEIGRPPAELGLDLEPLHVVEPRPGRLALFPSYLFHGTRPFANGERLTVAFDLLPGG